VKKEILASLMSSRLWRQVVPLIVDAKMSSASKKSRQDVRPKF